jgi:hypothetical protein
MKLDRYKKNLSVHLVDNGEYEVYSYKTHVATFKRGEPMVQMGWWSVTTQKHIRYVAQQYGISTIIKDY